ncbi:MAG: hypothetical protein ACTSWY_10175 [Promethearchaeota archaeon]
MFNFNFVNIDAQFKKIKDELDKLLKEMNIEGIPTRNELIGELYFRKLGENEFIVDGLLKERSEILKSTGKTKSKSKPAKIKLLLEQLEEGMDSNKKNELLKKIFKLITDISDDDKKVLLNSLIDEDVNQIKKSIGEILSVFLSESE